MMMNNGGQLPARRPISITQICITGMIEKFFFQIFHKIFKYSPFLGMMYLGQGNGDDFWFNVDQGRSNQVFSAHIGK